MTGKKRYRGFGDLSVLKYSDFKNWCWNDVSLSTARVLALQPKLLDQF